MHDLGLEAGVVGLIMAASGVGGIVAALVLERFFPVERARPVLLLSLLGVGAVLAGFSFVNITAVTPVLLFVLDFCWVGIFVYAGTLGQYGVRDELLARVESISENVFLLASTVSAACAAWLIPSYGVTVFMIAAAATVVFPLLALLRMPKDAISPAE
ncbi:MAG: hypothetical protein Q4C71_00920 [Microbacteriaceae bacterium]|nr:hypothetical protein [Microbacteriaceae bacterium]